MTVFLIRHAHAGSRQGWAGDDVARPLSPRGRRQATVIAVALAPRAPKRVLSSPYDRCVETVTPLARTLGLTVEVDPALAEGHAPEAVALTRALTGADVALCTHGDVVPLVLADLAEHDGLDVGPRPRRAKGSTWVLTASRGRFVAATYLAPAD